MSSKIKIILATTFIFLLVLLSSGILMCVVWGMSNANQTIPSSLTWLADIYTYDRIMFAILSVLSLLSGLAGIITWSIGLLIELIPNNKEKSSKNSGGF